MADNNYSLNQIKQYADSKVNKAFGYAGIFVAGYNLIIDAFQKDLLNISTPINTVVVLGGIGLACGIEDKIQNRTKIVKEISDMTDF